MRIHEIKIDGFRSFQDEVVLEEIKPISVFVGANGAGKSNVIEVFMFLKNLVLNQEFRTIDKLTFDSKSEVVIKISLELTKKEQIEIIEKVYSLYKGYRERKLEDTLFFKFITFQIVFDSTKIIAQDLFTLDNEGKIINFMHMSMHERDLVESILPLNDFFVGGREITEIKQEPLIRMVSGQYSYKFFSRHSEMIEGKLLEMFANFIKNIKIIPAYRKVESIAKFNEAKVITENGSNLVNVLNTLQTSSPTQYVKMRQKYSEIIKGVSEVIAPPASNNDVTAKMEEVGLTSQIDISNMSLGLQQCLIFLVAVNTFPKNSIVCIEEPEIHLHPKVQKKIFNLFKEKTSDYQFFITTHSSIFTGIEENITTYLIIKRNAVSTITTISEENNLKFIKQQLGLTNSDVFGHDFVIFLEGESEMEAFPIVASALGYKIDRGVRIFNLKGNGRMKKLQELLTYVKDEDTDIFLIADSDSEVSKKIEDFDREGLIKKEQTVIWEGEFEDIFESKFIVSAFNSYLKKDSGLKSQKLEEDRKTEKIGKILQKYCHEILNEKFSKPQFAKSVALKIQEEIQSNKDRTQTEFESQVIKIMNQIGIKREWESA